MFATLQTTADPQALCQFHDALKSERAPWDSVWSEISDYVMPRRDPGMCSLVPGTQRESRLFDTTAVQANMILANGCMAWMSPMEGAWFSFTPTPGGPDDVRQWLTACTGRTRDVLARSNFYTAIHEFYLDRGAFGIAAVYVEKGKKGLNVQHWPTGSFCVAEDDEGNVDTLVRSVRLTARQAVLKFGKEKLSKKLQEAADDTKRSTEKFEFLHFILPRQPDEVKAGGEAEGLISKASMPVASLYIEKETNHLVQVGGYEEMPVFVSRYLEWGSGYGGPYGWAPSFAALPEARQVNFLQKMLDALAEKMAFPPVLSPAELEGEIDPNAAGVTYFDSSLTNLPREWMQSGKYDVGKDRVIERQAAINKAFHVDLFTMFAQLDKQMTAREVAERSSEKLIQFSPTFARLVTELFNPLLERIFSILLRDQTFGQMADVPTAATRPAGNNMVFVAPPVVQYTSRIAQALRAMPILSMHRMFELLAPMVQTNPEVMDNLNLDEAVRMAANVENLPEGILRSEEEVQEIREARAEARAQAEQAAQAAMAAEAAAKLGSVPADSPVGEAMANNLPGALAAA